MDVNLMMLQIVSILLIASFFFWKVRKFQPIFAQDSFSKAPLRVKLTSSVGRTYMLSVFGLIAAIILGFIYTNEGWIYLVYTVVFVGLSVFSSPAITADEITMFAESGEWWAEYALGCLYQTGDSVDEVLGGDEFLRGPNYDWMTYSTTGKNLESAASWYKKAAEKGCIQAQNNLGGMYKNGTGVEQSPSEAIKWLTPPAEKGVSEAQFNLGIILKENIHDYTQAFHWLNKAANQENLDAMAQVAFMYLEGEGKESNYKKGIGLFKKAADKGHSHSQFFLGLGFLQGRWGVDLDYRKAFEWFSKAAEQGNTHAERELAKLYRKGHGVELDTCQAVRYLFSSACKGDCGAALELADIYANHEVDIALATELKTDVAFESVISQQRTIEIAKMSARTPKETYQILAYTWWRLARLFGDSDLYSQDDTQLNVPEELWDKVEGIELIIMGILLYREVSHNDGSVSMYELYHHMIFLLLNLPACPQVLSIDNSNIDIFTQFKLNILIPREAIQPCMDAHLKYAGVNKKKRLDIMMFLYSFKCNSVLDRVGPISPYFRAITGEFIRLAIWENQATVECSECKQYVYVKIEYTDDRVGLPGWHNNHEERWCCPCNHLVYQASLPRLHGCVIGG